MPLEKTSAIIGIGIVGEGFGVESGVDDDGGQGEVMDQGGSALGLALRRTSCGRDSRRFRNNVTRDHGLETVEPVCGRQKLGYY